MVQRDFPSAIDKLRRWSTKAVSTSKVASRSIYEIAEIGFKFVSSA